MGGSYRRSSSMQMELSNPEDHFAVAVYKHDITVGHVPRRILSICSSFLQRGGTITCRVTGVRRYSLRSDTAFLQVRKATCKVA